MKLAAVRAEVTAPNRDVSAATSVNTGGYSMHQRSPQDEVLDELVEVPGPDLDGLAAATVAHGRALADMPPSELEIRRRQRELEQRDTSRRAGRRSR